MASGYSGAFQKPDVRRTREEVEQSQVQRISRRLQAATTERDWSRALGVLDRRYNLEHVQPKHVSEFIDVFLRTTSDTASAAGLRAALDGCVAGTLPATPELMVAFAGAFRKRGDVDGAMEVVEQAHLLFEKGAAARAPEGGASKARGRGAQGLLTRRQEALADASKSKRDTAVLRKGERAKVYGGAAARRRPLVREDLFKPRAAAEPASPAATTTDTHSGASAGAGDRGPAVVGDPVARAMRGAAGSRPAGTSTAAGLPAMVKTDLLKHVLAICAETAAFDRAAHAVELLMPQTAASNPTLMPLLAKVRAESGSWLDALEIAGARHRDAVDSAAPAARARPMLAMSADGIARAGRSAAAAGQWQVALRLVERHEAAALAAGGGSPESTLEHEMLFSTLDATTRAGRWPEGLAVLDRLVDRVGYVDGRAADLAFGRCRIVAPTAGAEADVPSPRLDEVAEDALAAFPSPADTARGLAVRRCFEALSFKVDRFDLPPLATVSVAGHVTAAGDWTRGLQLLRRFSRSAVADLSRRSPPYVVAVAMATSAAAQMMPDHATGVVGAAAPPPLPHPSRTLLAHAFAATPWLLRPELLYQPGAATATSGDVPSSSPSWLGNVAGGGLSEDLAPLPLSGDDTDAMRHHAEVPAVAASLSSSVRPGRDAYAGQEARRTGGRGDVPMWQRYLHEASGRAAGRGKWAPVQGVADPHADPDAEPVGAFDPDSAWHHASRTHNNLTENPKTLRTPLQGWKGPRPSEYKPARSYRGGTV